MRLNSWAGMEDLPVSS